MVYLLAGVAIGIVIAAIWFIVSVVQRIETAMGTVIATQKLIIVEQGRLRQLAETNLEAAETFVDALRESAQHMNPNNGNKNMSAGNMFDDLRETFQNGIRGFEEEEDNNEDEEEDWQK